MEEIKNYQSALELLKDYILISKPYGGNRSFYLLKNEKILVLGNHIKYNITIEDFIRDFNCTKFYVYQAYTEVEIDSEYKKLRQ